MTTATSLATMASGVLVVRWLALALGPDDFGVYSISRRAVALSVPVVTLAAGISLPRFLGLHHEQRERQEQVAAAAILTALVPALLLSCAVVWWQDAIGWVLFRVAGYERAVVGAATMMLGVSVYTLAYAGYRGRSRMKAANLLQLVVASLGPLLFVGLYFDQLDVATALFGLGLIYFVALGSLLSLGRGLRRGVNPAVLRSLVEYGAPRTIGGLCLAGMFALGPLASPYFGTLRDAGYFAAGQSLFRIVGAAATSFGLVILPRAARRVGKSDERALGEPVQDLAMMVVQLGVFGSLQLLVWASILVGVWLGPAYTPAVSLVRILVVGLPAYLAYVIFRSIIDAVDVRAVNTGSLVAALTVATVLGIGLAATGSGALGLAIGVASGHLVLGCLSLWYLWRRYRFGFPTVVRSCLLSAVLAVACFGVARRIGGLSVLQQFAFCVASTGLAAVIYVAVLWKWQVPWIRNLPRRVFVQ